MFANRRLGVQRLFFQFATIPIFAGNMVQFGLTPGQSCAALRTAVVLIALSLPQALRGHSAMRLARSAAIRLAQRNRPA
jgi:hypothetical protein